MTTHRVDIASLPHGTASVSYLGDVLIPRTRQPLFDGARALSAMGFPDSDTVETWRPGTTTPAMRWTIGQARLWNATHDAQLNRWTPHPMVETRTVSTDPTPARAMFEIDLDLAFT